MNFRSKILPAVLFLLIPSAVSALSVDLSLALNVDVTPYGTEIIQPGAAVHCWLQEDAPISPGGAVELYWIKNRLDCTANILFKTGGDFFQLAGGAGAVLQFDSELNIYPDLELGGRISIDGWPVLMPLVSVRFKPGDSDTDLRGFCGVSVYHN